MAKNANQGRGEGTSPRSGSKAPTAGAATGASRASRRPEAVRARKEARRKQYDKQQRNWLYTKIAIGAVAALVIGGLAWGAWGQYQQWRVTKDVDTYFGAGDFVGQHNNDEPILYEQIPPVGGWHRPAGAWQNCGFYDKYIENERGVHSLEHGAVWITYDPNLPQDQIDSLRNRAENSSKILVSPYPGMDAPVIASVWGKQIKLDGANDDRLGPFIEEYMNNPGNTPEPGGICWSGISATTDQEPQQEPYIRSEGSEPVGGIPVSAATATAAALSPVQASPTVPAATEPPAAASTPAASPAASPGATPVGTPTATPESTPAT